MSEEIIIKTETIKVKELQGREKQIYDAGYSNGFQKGRSDRSLISVLAVIGLGSLVYFILSKFS